MLGLLFLYLIWTRFHKLAKTYNKEYAWLYPLVMIILYYVITFVVGAMIGLLYFVFQNTELELDKGMTYLVTLIGVIVALSSLYGIYHFLEKKWKKETPNLEDEINIIGKS